MYVCCVMEVNEWGTDRLCRVCNSLHVALHFINGREGFYAQEMFVYEE